jgi:hypothetical protein
MKDLFFTDTEHDEDQFFPSPEDFKPKGEDDDDEVYIPSRASGMFDEFGGIGQEDEETAVSHEKDEHPTTKVRFHEYMKVVLIPTKEEFKKANCDLWWKRTDFMSFQKNANAELRLVSMIQNISIQEAKHLLFQPQPASSSQETEPELTNNNLSVNYIPSSGEGLEEDIERAPSSPVPSKTSPVKEKEVESKAEIVQRIVEEHHAESNDPFSSLESSYQTARIFRSRNESEDSAYDDERQGKAKKEQEIASRRPRLPSEDLNLCVPVSEPVPASNNMRVSKYRTTLASAGLLAAMGLFSFAAPIIGFYFLSSQR